MDALSDEEKKTTVKKKGKKKNEVEVVALNEIEIYDLVDPKPLKKDWD